MRDIYLIDFENVASEGLNGITYLDPEDQVIIFYSNNSKSLSMKMHILIGKSVCHLDYFEASVGGKNALDHQISTWLGYLIGTGAAERNYYIVSRDMGYKFVASFWSESEQKPTVRCVDAIKIASKMERRQQEEAAKAEAAERMEPVEEPAAAAAETEEEQPEAEAEPVETQEPEQRRTVRGRQRYSRSRLKGRENAAAAQAGQSVENEAGAEEQDTKPKDKAETKQESKGKKAKKTQEEPKNGRGLELSVLIAPYPGLQEAHLRELIADNKKQVLCNTLRKQLGQEKGLALYNEIKKSAWR